MVKSISDIEGQANASANSRRFFSPAAMKAWGCIAYGETFDAGDDVALFITSERDKGVRLRSGELMAAHGGKRRFTIRISGNNGEVDTIGHMSQFADKRKALRIAAQVAQWWRTDTGPEDMDEWVKAQ